MALTFVSAPSVNPCHGEETVSVKAAMIPIPAPGESVGLWTGDRTPTKEVPVGGPGFSATVLLPRLEVWRFGHIAGEPGKKHFEEIGRVTPPPGNRVWLVFCQQEADRTPDAQESENPPEEGSGSKPAWDVLALEVDQASFPGGSAMILNRSGGPVEVEFGGETIVVEAKESAVLKPSSESESGHPVRFSYKRNDRKRPFVATNWLLSQSRRRLAVVIPQRENSPPKLITVDEILERKN